MKVGMRTPSPTRSLKAKTTGRVKRSVKRSVNPVYGIKGVGYLKDPERAIKNKIYHKVTVDPLENMKNAKMPDFDMPEYETEAAPKLGIVYLFALISLLSCITFFYHLFVDKYLDIGWLSVTVVFTIAYGIIYHYRTRNR